MKRKNFITTALLAIPTLSFAGILNFDKIKTNVSKLKKNPSL